MNVEQWKRSVWLGVGKNVENNKSLSETNMINQLID